MPVHHHVQSGHLQVQRGHVQGVRRIQLAALETDHSRLFYSSTNILLHIFYSLLVGFEDLLAVSDRSIYVLHVETNPHGLVHHVEHVDVGVVEDSPHLLEALLTHLHQLTRGCYGVKVASTPAEVELRCQRASD